MEKVCECQIANDHLNILRKLTLDFADAEKTVALAKLEIFMEKLVGRLSEYQESMATFKTAETAVCKVVHDHVVLCSQRVASV